MPGVLRAEAEIARIRLGRSVIAGDYKQNEGLIKVTSRLIRLLYGCFGGLQAEGLDFIPAEGGVIIAPNHLSWADPPAIRAMIRRRCWFMANDWLFRIPIMGPLLPLYGVFPVGRSENTGRPDRAALRRAEYHLLAGDAVAIFPEGGTSVTGRLFPFERGVASVALRLKLAIVPAAVTGSERLLPMKPPYLPRYAPGGVKVRFGPPLYPTMHEGESRSAAVDRITGELYCAVAAMLPQEYLPTEFLSTGKMPHHPAARPAGEACRVEDLPQ